MNAGRIWTRVIGLMIIDGVRGGLERSTAEDLLKENPMEFKYSGEREVILYPPKETSQLLAPYRRNFNSEALLSDMISGRFFDSGNGVKMKINPRGMLSPVLSSLIHELRLAWALRVLLPGISKVYEKEEAGYKRLYEKDEGVDDFHKVAVILFPLTKEGVFSIGENDESSFYSGITRNGKEMGIRFMAGIMAMFLGKDVDYKEEILAEGCIEIPSLKVQFTGDKNVLEKIATVLKYFKESSEPVVNSDSIREKLLRSNILLIHGFLSSFALDKEGMKLFLNTFFNFVQEDLQIVKKCFISAHHSNDANHKLVGHAGTSGSLSILDLLVRSHDGNRTRTKLSEEEIGKMVSEDLYSIFFRGTHDRILRGRNTEMILKAIYDRFKGSGISTEAQDIMGNIIMVSVFKSPKPDFEYFRRFIFMSEEFFEKYFPLLPSEERFPAFWAAINSGIGDDVTHKYLQNHCDDICSDDNQMRRLAEVIVAKDRKDMLVIPKKKEYYSKLLDCVFGYAIDSSRSRSSLDEFAKTIVMEMVDTPGTGKSCKDICGIKYDSKGVGLLQRLVNREDSSRLYIEKIYLWCFNQALMDNYVLLLGLLEHEHSNAKLSSMNFIYDLIVNNYDNLSLSFYESLLSLVIEKHQGRLVYRWYRSAARWWRGESEVMIREDVVKLIEDLNKGKGKNHIDTKLKLKMEGLIKEVREFGGVYNNVADRISQA